MGYKITVIAKMVTTELRYFFEDNLFKIKNELFKVYPFCESETRTDFYYRWQMTKAVGVKWCQGNLEVKSLVEASQPGRMGEVWKRYQSLKNWKNLNWTR